MCAVREVLGSTLRVTVCETPRCSWQQDLVACQLQRIAPQNNFPVQPNFPDETCYMCAAGVRPCQRRPEGRCRQCVMAEPPCCRVNARSTGRTEFGICRMAL